MTEPFLAETYKADVGYFQRFLSESSILEEQVSSFSYCLSKSSLSLILRQQSSKQFSIIQMKMIRESISSLIEKTKDRIQRQCLLLGEVSTLIRKSAQQLKKILDIMKSEQEKGIVKIRQLQKSLKEKEYEIQKCQIDLEEEKNKIAEMSWKKLHYKDCCKIEGIQICGGNYLRVLKGIKNKINCQLTFERQQQAKFATNITKKLKESKEKILRIWQILSSSPTSPPKVIYTSQPLDQNQLKQEISDLQKRYLQKQQIIDEFEIGDLIDIKRKLRLLQQADMSESREQTHNLSIPQRRENMLESEVVELLKS